MLPILHTVAFFSRLIANIVPIVVMILLVPLVQDDLVLTAIYVVFILLALALRQDKKDLVFLVFGFFTLLFSEYLFISTGVEVFERASLFGVMPVWLPFLWAYVFIAIRSMVHALDRYLDHREH